MITIELGGPVREPNTGIHARTHKHFVEGCFACKVSTVALSAAATPTRRTVRKPRTEKES